MDEDVLFARLYGIRIAALTNLVLRSNPRCGMSRLDIAEALIGISRDGAGISPEQAAVHALR